MREQDLGMAKGEKGVNTSAPWSQSTAQVHALPGSKVSCQQSPYLFSSPLLSNSGNNHHLQGRLTTPWAVLQAAPVDSHFREVGIVDQYVLQTCELKWRSWTPLVSRELDWNILFITVLANGPRVPLSAGKSSTTR